jgi:hypothetical protein
MPSFRDRASLRPEQFQRAPHLGREGGRKRHHSFRDLLRSPLAQQVEQLSNKPQRKYKDAQGELLFPNQNWN